MQNVICVKKDTNQTNFMSDNLIGTWAWGKKLKNWNIYVITEGEIINVPIESFNAMDIARHVQGFIKEPCQG